MSTKIYQAYLWNGTVNELIQWLQGFRKAYVKAAIDFLKPVRGRMVSSNRSETHPFGALGRDERSAWSYLMDTIKEGKNEPFNLGCSAAVYFHGKRILVHFFGVDGPLGGLNAMIGKEKRLRDFSYWNNTDRPEGVSESDWRKRERVWDKVMEGSGIPAEIGLTYELSTSNSMWEIVGGIFEKCLPGGEDNWETPNPAFSAGEAP